MVTDVQPIKDTEHLDEVHHQRAIPQTHIEERHVSTDTDKANFTGLDKVVDSTHRGPKERTVVDLGEKVNETTHRMFSISFRCLDSSHLSDHVSNVIQPVLVKDTHEHHKIVGLFLRFSPRDSLAPQHTVIPTHHVTHEAPIVHVRRSIVYR